MGVKQDQSLSHHPVDFIAILFVIFVPSVVKKKARTRVEPGLEKLKFRQRSETK